MIEKNTESLAILQQFLDNIVIEAGLSKNTVDSYTRDLKDFYNFLSKRRPIKNLKNATLEDILQYVKLLAQNNFNAKTQSRRISAMKKFYKFCYSEAIINHNPSLDIKNPKIAKSLPKFLTIQQIEAILNEAKLSNYRFYVMLEILYATGLRISELVTLKLGNIIEDSNFLIIKGKGGKERIVPLSSIAKLQLSIWLHQRHAIKGLSANNTYIFPSNTALEQHITRERFAQILKQMAIKCNINADMVSPHLIRHSFASHLLNNGANLKHIQSLLGHSDISTTEIYTHVLDYKFKEAIYNHHPLAKVTFNKK